MIVVGDGGALGDHALPSVEPMVLGHLLLRRWTLRVECSTFILSRILCPETYLQRRVSSDHISIIMRAHFWSALFGFMVDVEDSEALGEAQLPFEIVE